MAAKKNSMKVVYCDFVAFLFLNQIHFFLESFSTHFTKQCFKCLLQMIKHIIEVIDVTIVEDSSG